MKYKDIILEKINERIEELEKDRESYNDLVKRGILTSDEASANDSRDSAELIFLRGIPRMIKFDRKCERCKDNLVEYYSLDKYLCPDCHDDMWYDPT